ncbi:MAG: hypothetical protein WC889_19190, partial [Myxococcota bacterium]
DGFQCNVEGRRTLLYFPIIHSQIEMGELSEAVKQMELEKIGLREWSRKAKIIEQYWNRIEACIGTVNFRYDRTRLYQDGLPVCGRESDIVVELAEKGIFNYRLLRMLMKKGAILEGTESPMLITQEYELTKSLLSPAGTNGVVTEKFRSSYGEVAAGILKRRDEFIAKRIDETLKTGEAGVLFIGMLHKVKALIPEDINVILPLDRFRPGTGV